ncbi:hypothetical protein P3T40_000184 [Paraburkholderia sp. EB58]|jgi:hypothetical protein
MTMMVVPQRKRNTNLAHATPWSVSKATHADRSVSIRIKAVEVEVCEEDNSNGSSTNAQTIDAVRLDRPARVAVISTSVLLAKNPGILESRGISL